ncbi:MAG: endolytic transglycosylase MltG [Dysgonamonadaceae bacterium]|jgi:UPF0755 protein|nr:endolytic transglycosylase MltG [Dysgonamonadaceae bacterium]
MKKKRKVWTIIAASLASVILAIGSSYIYVYKKYMSPFFNVKQTVYVYVNDNKDYNDLLSQLQSVAHIKDVNIFDKIAGTMKYPDNMRTGRYAVTPDMTCKQLLQNLRNGNQAPSRITFNNIRLKEDLAKRISEQLMFSEGELYQQLNDSAVCAQFGFDTNTILCMFIPNTYEMYWNIPVEKFIKKMKSEYDKFWTPERIEKAQEIPLTPIQVSIVASIVEEETAANSEFSTVAGLYINRLKRGMLLQADPTVKYAVGDFSLKRILFVHLEKDSPYNTYKYAGLPPGPIRIPSIRGIDAVLNHAQHNYIYMCAKEDFSGKHNFATTLSEHNTNAAKYQAALNRNKIK